jgi:DNA-directed RNA polymerase subunit RPC12/RpoP
MRIKKFTCISCGAPKVNEYKSPYIVCDYCGSFTDIDFTLGMGFWNQSPLKNIGYAFNKMDYMNRMQHALQKNDRQEYWRLQRGYWDYYYRTYPAYLPPSIDDGYKYRDYLDVCAESSTEAGFEPKYNQMAQEQQQLQQQLVYYYVNMQPKVQTEGFFKLAEFFIGMTKEGFKVFYDNPKYAVMNDLLPEQVHLKMKLSMFVQAWLPYLTEDDTDRFLKMTGFSTQYVEIEKPKGGPGECSNCKAEIYIPEGAYKVYCEACHRTTKIHAAFKCMSCGADNKVPDNPGKPIDCEFCGVENRLIQRLFG